MEIKIDAVYLVWAAFAVIGDVQWLRSLIDAIKNKGNWLYAVLSFVFSVAIAFAGASISNGGIFQVLTNAAILLALVELSYKNIIQTINAIIDAIRDKLTWVKFQRVQEASGQPPIDQGR